MSRCCVVHSWQCLMPLWGSDAEFLNSKTLSFRQMILSCSTCWSFCILPVDRLRKCRISLLHLLIFYTLIPVPLTILSLLRVVDGMSDYWHSEKSAALPAWSIYTAWPFCPLPWLNCQPSWPIVSVASHDSDMWLGSFSWVDFMQEVSWSREDFLWWRGDPAPIFSCFP